MKKWVNDKNVSCKRDEVRNFIGNKGFDDGTKKPEDKSQKKSDEEKIHVNIREEYVSYNLDKKKSLPPSHIIHQEPPSSTIDQHAPATILPPTGPSHRQQPGQWRSNSPAAGPARPNRDPVRPVVGPIANSTVTRRWPDLSPLTSPAGPVWPDVSLGCSRRFASVLFRITHRGENKHDGFQGVGYGDVDGHFCVCMWLDHRDDDDYRD
ncbi:hypothetical protein AKJ16_DCAP08950 [Drosera capensis]